MNTNLRHQDNDSNRDSDRRRQPGCERTLTRTYDGR
jgi:hypothetical protein